MEKSRLAALFAFFAGLVLMIGAWWTSYPLSIDSVGDVIFNHLSILYWFSVPLLLASLYMVHVTFKSNSMKWLATVGIVLTMYSLSYFYYLLPGSDSQAFRGLSEYFAETKDLDPLKVYHGYFQWPSFFLLNNISNTVSGMQLAHFEFLLYAIIGFLLTSAMYVYVSRVYKREGLLAVATFFMAMFYFLNYQAVPFSLAFALLFLLFMLETRQKNFEVGLVTLILFTGIVFTHAFVPLFFVLYLFIRSVLNRSKEYGRLVLLTLAIYLVVQLVQGPNSFFENLRNVLTVPSEYSSIVQAVLAPISVPIDEIAQIGSRGVTVTTVMICLIGSAVLFVRRKARDVDKGVFLTGVFYFAFGFVYFALGSRALPLIFFPISLGSSYLLTTRVRPLLKFFFVILLAMFVFVPLHGSFGASQIMYETKSNYHTDGFLVSTYNWTNPSLILAHYRVVTYLQTKQVGGATFEDDVYSPLFPRIGEYDCVVYTVGLGINMLRYNYTADTLLGGANLNTIYTCGPSFLAVKSSNFTFARVR